MSRQLVPLLDRVLVRRLMAQEKTSTGILLPESSMKRVNEGTVVAVGSGGRTSSGGVIPVSVSVGDRVVLPEYGGTSLKFEGQEDLTLYRDDEILAIIKDK